jgi:hypothetical protein
MPAVLVEEVRTGALKEIAIWGTCASLAMFLSTLAGRETAEPSFGTLNRLSFGVLRTPGGDIDAIEVGTAGTDDRHDLMDLAFVQLLALVQLSGLRRVHVCDSPVFKRASPGGRGQYWPCGRLFVKTTKEKYCSTSCQKRVAMQVKRRKDRAEAEKQRRAEADRRELRRRKN